VEPKDSNATHPPGVIAVPATDTLCTGAAVSVLNAFTEAPKGTGVLFHTAGTTIAEKRYYAVRNGLLNFPERQWVFFIDSDMLIPAGTLTRLLSHNVDIVGALYVLRKRLHGGKECVAAGNADSSGNYQPLKDFTGGLQRVDGAGTGCLLVRRRVFEDMAHYEPWFHCDGVAANEDAHFAYFAGQAGIPFHVDTGAVVGHITGTALWPVTPNPRNNPPSAASVT
jgi:hypothetical protein